MNPFMMPVAGLVRLVPMNAIAVRCFVLLLLGCGITACAGENDDDTVKQLEVGDRAIEFDLPVVGGEEYLSLREQYKQGPVVVVVLRGYPGYQCLLCSRQVASLSNRAATLGKHAQRVILVYPGAASMLEQHAEQFMGARSLPEPLVIVRDEGMEMVAQWGLRWDAINETAYPATFVIDRNGRVRWSKVSQSHAGRSTVEEILKELRKL